jgi:hypothetical protein
MTDFTALAIKLAQGTREKLEDEIVVLDSEVAQVDQTIMELQSKEAYERGKADFLWKKRSAILSTHSRLVMVLRELKRPRAGWPDLSDSEYEMKLADLRSEVQTLVELSVES